MKSNNHAFKSTIKQFKEQLCDEFTASGNINTIARKLSLFIDTLLIELFVINKLDDNDNFCLIALGSYGRRELQLHSDIDILLLHTSSVKEVELHYAQKFIQDCWDIGLEVSHQITTVDQCAQLASDDLSVVSTLMDMFLLCGRGGLMEELTYQIHPLHMWSSHDYFFAKIKEKQNRYLKYGETEYNLEPNVKFSPGGLRDLQLLLSISKRHFQAKKLADGICYGFITEKEYEELTHCQHFLWRVRFALHLLANKAEERLSFEYQIKLAQFFSYVDKPHSLAIEQFMKDYFKVIKRTRELNEMLLQWFNETIVHQQKQRLTPLDNELQLSNTYIEIRHPKVFQQNPKALLTLFLWIASCPNITGVRANTVRLIRDSLFLINKKFKENPSINQLFLAILKSDHDPYEALQQMSRHGVLAHFLDCFSNVTGQMQYDLFHSYTVDQHTLFVIRNISRFKNQQYAVQFPLCAQVIKLIAKPEILYLSALFHDIAKGRGGDHSELGAIEAQNFAHRLKLNQEDTHLLTWLVQNHLLMSQIAQRKDIYDPATIKQFCALLPKIEYLDYLYLLTVADICGTSPKLWNAWKDSLLKELYRAAKTMIHKEQLLLDEHLLIDKQKEEAIALIECKEFSRDEINKLWSKFKGKYFLHETPSIIAQHTIAILRCTQFPLIMIMPHHSQGGTEVFIYMPQTDNRFTIATTVLANYQVSIQEALVCTCSNNFALDTYIILDEHNQAFFEPQRLKAIQDALLSQLSKPNIIPKVTSRRLPRKLAHFNVTTKISYNDDSENNTTELFLITNDRPGLLATISKVFLKESIHVHNAKIATVGGRAEDMFNITNMANQPLTLNEKNQLNDKLQHELNKKLS